MQRRAFLAAALAATAPAFANTPPAEVSGELAGARLVGAGRLRFMGFSVYDARLWAPVPPADPLAVPLALELAYTRRLVGKLIAERSLAEMKRQGPIDDATGARWLQAMLQLFPDVAEGDRLTGVHRPGEAARFFHNGRFVGEIRDAEFARRFFGIWLTPQTSEPSLREALLGRQP
jgi:hypothetical protein